MTPKSPVERISVLETQMIDVQKTQAEFSKAVVEIASFVSETKGEKRAIDKMHRQNQWLLGVIIAILSLLFTYEATHHHSDPQRTTQAQPGPAHSDMPAEFDASARN